jgi:glucose-6-phosphate isomerase
LAEEVQLADKIEKMFKGEKINVTEKRSVLHVALRMAREKSLEVDGRDVVKDVWEVRDGVKVMWRKKRMI